jgi:hypothetical protein
MKQEATARKRAKAPHEILSELESGPVGRTFAMMRIAEEEIDAAKARWSRKADVLQGAFRWLCPPAGMSSYHESIYRAYARELIERVGSGSGPALAAELALGTRAEAMLALSQASLRAPLDRTHQALFERLFTEVMGRAIEGEPTREPYPGAADEALHQLLRRCGQARR